MGALCLCLTARAGSLGQQPVLESAAQRLGVCIDMSLSLARRACLTNWKACEGSTVEERGEAFASGALRLVGLPGHLLLERELFMVL